MHWWFGYNAHLAPDDQRESNQRRLHIVADLLLLSSDQRKPNSRCGDERAEQLLQHAFGKQRFSDSSRRHGLSIRYNLCLHLQLNSTCNKLPCANDCGTVHKLGYWGISILRRAGRCSNASVGSNRGGAVTPTLKWALPSFLTGRNQARGRATIRIMSGCSKKSKRTPLREPTTGTQPT